MIQITDYDLPIQVAEKIIRGTKENFRGETGSGRIFELEEIKEIADYLMVYYKAHINEV